MRNFVRSSGCPYGCTCFAAFCPTGKAMWRNIWRLARLLPVERFDMVQLVLTPEQQKIYVQWEKATRAYLAHIGK